MDVSSILTALKQNGHRITAGRKAVVSALATMTTPIGATELHAMLAKKRINVNKVTVYRELAFLEEQGIAIAVTFKDGTKRYEIADTDHHHHHLICTSCQSVQDVEMAHDLDDVEKKIRKDKSFTVQSHSLEFYGLCKRCA